MTIAETCQRIIDDLNAIRKEHYPQSRGFRWQVYRPEINARLKNGYTVEDFLEVHRKKAYWLKDPKMVKYYNPETLYRPKHFDKYLNEIPYADLTPEQKTVIIRDQNIRAAEERQTEHPEKTKYEAALCELGAQWKAGLITEEQFIVGRNELQEAYSGQPKLSDKQLYANKKRIDEILGKCFKTIPSGGDV